MVNKMDLCKIFSLAAMMLFFRIAKLRLLFTQRYSWVLIIFAESFLVLFSS